MSGQLQHHDYGSDIYTEAEGDDDTLANLGPLRSMAGIWTSADGADVHPVGPGSDITGPVIDGDEHNVFVEQLRAAADRPADERTAAALRPALPHPHREARRGRDVPRPGRLLALGAGGAHRAPHARDPARSGGSWPPGRAEPDATEFEVSAALGAEGYGILSNPFLDRRSAPSAFRIRVTVHDDGTWSYEEHTMMRVPGRAELVDHVDRNTLRRIGEPTPNPLAVGPETAHAPDAAVAGASADAGRRPAGAPRAVRASDRRCRARR